MARGRGGGGSVSFSVSSPAVIFAILHGVMLLLFIAKTLTEPSSVFIFLVLFCAIRVASFGMEATLQNPDVGNGVDLTAAGLWEFGIFALLYSAYTLVLDRGVASGVFAKKMITQITRCFICLLLAIAVAVGIRGLVFHAQALAVLDSVYEAKHFPGADPIQRAFDKADSLDEKSFVFQKVAVYTFLAVTALLAVQTLVLLSWEHSGLARRSVNGQPTEKAEVYARYMPSLIVIALLTRGIYRTVAINEIEARHTIEFYLLGALPEWLALLFFGLKCVVPKREDVVPPTPDREKDFVVA